METHPVRQHLDPEFADTYALVQRWRDESLPSGTSLIRPDAIVWTPEIAAELERRIALAPDESKDTFVGKLVAQLDGASQEVHLLLADLLVVHLLATRNIGLEKKLGLVDAVGGMAPEPFNVPDTLHPALRRGPVNAGIGFLTLRFCPPGTEQRPARADDRLQVTLPRRDQRKSFIDQACMLFHGQALHVSAVPVQRSTASASSSASWSDSPFLMTTTKSMSLSDPPSRRAADP